MSPTPTNSRPDEEALAALLIIVALGFGSLFAVAKSAANRFVGSALKEAEHGSDHDEVDCEPQVTKEQHRIGVDRDGTISIQSGHSMMEGNNDGRLQKTRAKDEVPQLPFTQRDLHWEEGLNAIRAWEEATTSRTQRERARRLERYSSISQSKCSEAVRAMTTRREVSWNEGVDAVNA
ncbi:MAG: hypothetical protein Q9175_004395 [Cornicularia normoerica]